jgi:predicted MPP superfamily phosphohydrolase
VASTFLHLSDIHFRRNANTPWDACRDLRNELERDAIEIGKELGGVHAILISGDIAFSGHEDKYKIAHDWLRQISKKLNCEPDNVWMVPGNHDVDREIIKKSMIRFPEASLHDVLGLVCLTKRTRNLPWATP